MALLSLVSIFLLNALVGATQVMHRPDDYRHSSYGYSAGMNSANKQGPYKAQDDSTGYVSSAYFANWDIYGADFIPTDINVTILSHIYYAFANVDADTGEISLTDLYADTEIHFDGDSWDEPGNNLYGCLKQMYLFKLANHNLKVLLSIGGYTYSQEGNFDFVTNSTSRTTFVQNAVQFVENYGLDGVDIDYEYPASTDQGQGFADLLTELRTAFDELATNKSDTVPYQITVAVSAGSANYEYLVVPQMDEAVTYWNLMAYDYAGSWLTWTDNQANLYGGARTGVSTDKAIKWYVSEGATISKINMGIPLYGRVFEDTDGLGDSYDGVRAFYLVFLIPSSPYAGATIYENFTDVTSYSYDPTTLELVSYDVPDIVAVKAQYMITNGMAGSMFWELSTDKTGNDSLVGVVAGVLGTLDQTQNHIDYPDSEWDNIANNMGESTSTTTSASSTSTSVTSTATSTTTSGSDPCSGVSTWSSTATYVGGDTAVYDNYLWTAKWWTYGDVPGGAGQFCLLLLKTANILTGFSWSVGADSRMWFVCSPLSSDGDRPAASRNETPPGHTLNFKLNIYF
ncbi:glycoside hydrolase family 18 protein [Fistulina hepatica ATCC 64428]|uniref:Glycoside hydrolase family 18 protein n=1 Tax=Fistulina hepatica ATCC 64428 TaxID=1128425 RepID=A0A0D7ABF1_9AGAR|nr:glycoside hydrolase family 18 protein [Fistulina hepatica ATCC 64428]